jgi:hypothetical protein
VRYKSRYAFWKVFCGNWYVVGSAIVKFGIHGKAGRTARFEAHAELNHEPSVTSVFH